MHADVTEKSGGGQKKKRKPAEKYETKIQRDSSIFSDRSKRPIRHGVVWAA